MPLKFLVDDSLSSRSPLRYPPSLGNVDDDPFRTAVLSLDVGVACLVHPHAQSLIDVMAGLELRVGQLPVDLLQVLYLKAEKSDPCRTRNQRMLPIGLPHLPS